MDKIREDMIGSLIFQFWINTGRKGNNICTLISNIFEEMPIDNYNEIEKASVKFKDYSNDNNKLINALSNLDINKNLNNNLNNFQEKNEIDKDYEEDESEEEGNSLGCSENNEYEERIIDKDNDYINDDELLDEIDLFKNISINFEGKICQMQNELLLNEDKINYLLDERNNINFFQIGHTIVDSIISYINNKELDEKMSEDIKEKLIKYDEILKSKKELNMWIDANTIKQYKIVGMTTTGCAKYSTIIETLKFEVVIVEEAAEVLEPHILALLTKNTKRLIMIGDHKQLRPKPYSYELSQKYNFNVSMFERLINNGIKYVSLKYQRRMKPLFADFIRLIYGDAEYIDKQNDDEAYKENIRGMTSDMFIITHTKPESNVEGMKSKCNEYEAHYLVKLYSYLLKQGYKSSQITILTFYIGQVMKILGILKESFSEEKDELNNLKVSTVDNYQGEENDIILLSLVRSNSENNIGFLRDFNRVCVAFSRAKFGFYVIGNIEFIIQGIDKLKKKKDDKNQKNSLDEKMVDVWEKIKYKATKLNIIGEKLILKCCHKQTEISHYKDFANFPDGGCNERCLKRKKCGHTCEKFCHNFKCEDIVCTKICNKINPNCPLKKHKCKKLCAEECGPCTEKVKITLECGHEIEYECSQMNNKNALKCQKPCNKLLKCGHQCKLKCYEKCENGHCMELVKRKLPCEHIIEVNCYLPIYEILCDKKCNKQLPCGHMCNGTCGKCLGGSLHVKCTNECQKNLVCGHKCHQKCISECICTQKCPNVCLHGKCGELCCDECIDCEEDCEIKCPHRKCQKKCGEICNVEPCNKRCEKIMKCKHQCMGLCGEKCPNLCKKCNPNDETFTIFFGNENDDDSLFYETACGHIFECRGMDTYINTQKSISIPLCPKCLKQLVWEPRYQNYIREQFKIIQKIKQNYAKKYNNNEELLKILKTKSNEIINNIIKEYKENKILFFKLVEKKNNLNNNNLILEDNLINYEKSDLKSKLPIIYNFVRNLDINNIKFKLNSIYNLLTLSEKFIAIEYMNYEINKKEKSGQDISKDESLFIHNFFVIKDYFSQNSEIFTHFFFNQLKIKVDNMLYYTLLKLNPKIMNSEKEGFNPIINSNFSNKDLKLLNLYKSYNINMNKELFMGNFGSIWYKCSKGHIFCVEIKDNNKNDNNIKNDNGNVDLKCPLCLKNNNKNILNNKQVDIKEEIINSINKKLEVYYFLNQD